MKGRKNREGPGTTTTATVTTSSGSSATPTGSSARKTRRYISSRRNSDPSSLERQSSSTHTSTYDSNNKNSDNNIYRRSNTSDVDSISRFPYQSPSQQQQQQQQQQQYQQRGGFQRQRSRSADNNSSAEDSMEFHANENDGDNNTTTTPSSSFVTVGSNIMSATTDGGSSTHTAMSAASDADQLMATNYSSLVDEVDPNDSFLMDESAASTAFLMLQESATFPNEFDDDDEDYNRRQQDPNETLQSQEQEQAPQIIQQYPEQAPCWNFAMEHRIFLKAALELLAQRDKVATEVGMNDPNIIKSGPLKKASHLMRGIWKVKYVEIRRGMFSYYEDAVSENTAATTTTSDDQLPMQQQQQPLNQQVQQPALSQQHQQQQQQQQHQHQQQQSAPPQNQQQQTQSKLHRSLLRKNIPLEANSCRCRAVRLHQKAWNITPRGAILELAIAGRPKRLWMANTREERQAWIQAIHDAMVGGSVTRGVTMSSSSSHHQHHHGGGGSGGGGGGVDPKSPYKEDLKKYTKVQAQLKLAKSKDDYSVALRSIFRHELNVPVKWIIKQAEQEAKSNTGTSAGEKFITGINAVATAGGITSGGGTSGGGDVKGAFHEQDVKFSVDQLFKDLLRDTVKINGEIYRGSSGHAPERITGALARKILLCGRRSYSCEDDDDNNNGNIQQQPQQQKSVSKYDMSESQALAYARDILLSGNRTRSGGDSYFCVNTLCKNEELVVVVPSSADAEPVSITIARDDESGEGSGMATHDMQSKVGWLRTRRRSKNPWVKAYFVLSEGTLSFYEQALPRPHGLQGQIALPEATISVSREDSKCTNSVNGTNANKSNLFVLTIVAKDKSERQILFDSGERLLVWAYALECSAKAKGGTAPAPLMKAMKSVMARMPRVSVVPGTVGGPSGRRASMSSGPFTTPDDGSARLEAATTAMTAEAALREHVANLGLSYNMIEERLAAFANQTSEVVKVSIEAGTVYKICTLDPQGDEKEDTWAVVDATFLQEFRVSGGTNGRIIRGEEIVRVDVTRCSPIPRNRRTQSQQDRTDHARAGSPNSPGHRMQRLLRTSSYEVDTRNNNNNK